MFVHEKEGRLEGFTDNSHYFLNTTWWRKISAFSVDKDVAEKAIAKRKILYKILVAGLLSLPLLVGAFFVINSNNWAVGIVMTICSAVLLVGILAMGPGEEIENLNKPGAYYRKYPVCQENKLNRSDHIYPLGIQVSSQLFGEADENFWQKFLSLSKDKESLFAEATEIMIIENKLLDSYVEINKYLAQTHGSILEKDVKKKREDILNIHKQLTQRFEIFKENVLKASENERNSKVIKAMQQIDQIAA